MNINHLAIFYAVYREGSISIGAERLHISQPAVSKQLKEFEASLKTVLFDRHPRGVAATQSGELLAIYAAKIFELEAEAEQALSELNGLQSGKLTIGASLTIGNYLLPQILSSFHQMHPAIEVIVTIANTEVVQRKLIDGELDVGLTEGYVETTELEMEVFGEDELVAIAPAGHQILDNLPVTLDRLCSEDFVLRELGSGTREVVERTLAEHGGFVLRAVMSLGDIEAVKRAVLNGIGLGFVSTHSITQECEMKTIERIEVKDFTIRRPLHLLLRRGKYVTNATRALLPILRQARS
jgi:DNA-binding transcriptional LysR family regulator